MKTPQNWTRATHYGAQPQKEGGKLTEVDGVDMTTNRVRKVEKKKTRKPN